MPRGSTGPESGRPTIKDVARAAYVGLATASRALNNGAGVSEETKQRVLSAAQRIGYRPNRAAKNLRARRSNTLGALVPSLANPIFELYLRGAAREAGRLGFSMFICDAEYDAQLYRDHLERLLEHRVDGLVICEQIQARHLFDAVLTEGIPTDPEIQYASGLAPFRLTQPEAMQTAMADIARAGHRHVAFVRLTRPDHEIARPTSDARVAFVRDSLVECWGSRARFELWEYPPDADLVALLLPKLKGRSRPTALVVTAPALQGVLMAIQEAGPRIPEEISLISMGDTGWAQAYSPPISAVSTDQYESGIRAVRRVVGRITGDEAMVAANPPCQAVYYARASIAAAPKLRAH